MAPSGSLPAMSQVLLGVDFGLSVTDVVKVVDGEVLAHAARHRPGPASRQLLRGMIDDLEAGAIEKGGVRGARIGVTGGRSRELVGQENDHVLQHVSETDAVARGGLALAGVRRALVVSCGTGTAMV